MTPGEVSLIGREAMTTVLMLAGPVLIVVSVVGALISLFQAVTQVHEVTLTFLPKLLAVALVLAVASGWMLEHSVAYAQRSFDRIADVSK